MGEGGGRVNSVVEYLVSENCFDAPTHCTNACYAVIFTKLNPKQNSNRVGMEECWSVLNPTL